MANKMTLERLAEKIDSGFDRMEQKFEGVGEEFVSLREEFGERFDAIESTMKHNHAELGSRLTSLEGRTRTLEAR